METIVADPHLRNESVELGFDQHRSQYRFENRLAASVQMLGDPEYGAATRTAQLPTSLASSSARLTDRARAGESAMAGAGPNDRVRAQSTNVRNGVVTASTAGACAQCRTTDSLLGRRWRRLAGRDAGNIDGGPAGYFDEVGSVGGVRQTEKT